MKNHCRHRFLPAWRTINWSLPEEEEVLGEEEENRRSGHGSPEHGIYSRDQTRKTEGQTASMRHNGWSRLLGRRVLH